MNPTSQRFRRRRLSGVAALLGALLSPVVASAQPAPQEKPVDAAPPASSPTQSTEAPSPAKAAATESPGSSALAEKVATQQAEIDALLATSKDQEKAVASLRQQAAAASDETPTKLLSFWGFSDLTFGGIYYDKSNAAYKVATPAHATFFSSGINLYVKSEMTRTLSALIETRLTYTPNGITNDYPTTVNIGSTTIQTSPGTPPANTTVNGAYSQLAYRQDGLLIERAYMEWKPADWFGVRVGRFLTPFGIWNEDHGSPVLIGVDYPQFMNFNLVPIWQLGVEVFGSVGLGEDLRAEYALTLANSNGPSDEFKDLTNMKALGARLKFVYSHDKLYARLGGYVYYNQYRDTTIGLDAQITPNLTIDPAYNPAIGSTVQTNASYDETVITGDAELRYAKLRLLGEFARQTVIYNMATPIGPVSKLLKGVSQDVNVFDPSHYGFGGYVLAAYQMDFRARSLAFSVTPYAGYDYVVPESTVPTTTTTQLRAGLNIKPSPYVTLKAEVSRVLPEAKAVGSQSTGVFSQLAFSF